MTKSDPPTRRIPLFRDDATQGIRIPADFELPGSEAIISHACDRLIVEAAANSSLLELLASWERLDEPFPDVSETLLPLQDVDFDPPSD